MDSPLINQQRAVWLVPTDALTVRTLKAGLQGDSVRVEPCPTLDDFLAECDPHHVGCLVFHFEPRDEAFGVFRELAGRGMHLPVIALSECGEVPVVVQALRSGAFNYLKKPCTEHGLASAVHEALAWDAQHRQHRVFQRRIHRRLSHLTVGEQAVLDHLLDGYSNAQIAEQLKLSVRAVETRRSKLMKKMKANSLAELVRLTLTARLTGPLPHGAAEVASPPAEAKDRPSDGM
jgi:two-component system response regulator FixJ